MRRNFPRSFSLNSTWKRFRLIWNSFASMTLSILRNAEFRGFTLGIGSKICGAEFGLRLTAITGERESVLAQSNWRSRTRPAVCRRLLVRRKRDVARRWNTGGADAARV